MAAGRTAWRIWLGWWLPDLRGGGNDISDDVVARMQIENGAAGSVDIVARLLEATFDSGSPQGAAKAEAEDDRHAKSDGEVEVGAAVPFRGTM